MLFVVAPNTWQSRRVLQQAGTRAIETKGELLVQLVASGDVYLLPAGLDTLEVREVVVDLSNIPRCPAASSKFFCPLHKSPLEAICVACGAESFLVCRDHPRIMALVRSIDNALSIVCINVVDGGRAWRVERMVRCVDEAPEWMTEAAEPAHMRCVGTVIWPKTRRTRHSTAKNGK